MLRTPQHRSGTTDSTFRIDQLGRVKQRTARITLVSTGTGGSTFRTDSFHKTIGQEPLVMFTIELLDLRFPDIPGRINLLEDILDNRSLHGAACPAERIEVDFKPLVDIPM